MQFAARRLGFILVVFTALSIQSAFAAGPDVIVGDLYSLTDYDRLGDTAALAVGTISCNAGTAELNWYALPNNQHPVIGQNFYRLKDGRLQQIGQAWLKHGFTALQETTCYNDCQSSGTGSRLGIHCSDPYGPSLNSGPNLGPRTEVNPVTAYYNGATANNHSGHTHTAISHGLQVKHADLGNAGARYFVEGQYLAPDDATSGNGNNNASYREYSVSGTSSNWTFTPVGSTNREQPAINAWPGATRVILDNWPTDGRLIVACLVTSLGGGQYRYEYAVYNMNSDRGVRAFSVPVGSATISNPGFSAPLSHDLGLSNAPWSTSNVSGNFTWYTDNYGTDPNANAIRWGTMYNFWFDANVAPINSGITLSRFKPGAGPATVFAAMQAPGVLDCNGNTIPDDVEIAGGAPDCNSNGLLDACELNGNDCNGNFVPDDCELGADCNSNGLPDVCDLATDDCDSNGVPDACQSDGDCNSNGILDVCDAIGNDCDSNGVPDGCQDDCDHDGTIDPCENAPDCNGNSIPDSCDLAGVSNEQVTYQSGAVNLPILDNQTTTSTINVADTGQVVDVNVQLNLTHTFDGDLTIRLTHGATVRNLVVRRGGSGDNFQNTIFDDEAATAITAGSPPYAGTYRPEQSLSIFDTQASSGGWALSVQDSFGGDIGTLHSWSVTITRNAPPISQDTNANTIPDECECAGCEGNVNGDGDLDGEDIQKFLDYMTAGTFNMCADIDNDGPPLDDQDLEALVELLLNSEGPCP